MRAVSGISPLLEVSLKSALAWAEKGHNLTPPANIAGASARRPQRGDGNVKGHSIPSLVRRAFRWVLSARWGLAGVASRIIAAVMTVAGVVLMAVSFVAPGVASANAANPAPGTAATSSVNGSAVTINLSGTWTWPNQDCAGRYGEGWAVDWWGVSTSYTPSPNFSVTATQVTAPGVVQTQSESFSSALAIKNTAPTKYFHVGPLYNGEDVNSAATCTDTGSGSTGAWAASATYPQASDVPPQLCVIMYDEHGTEGNPSNQTSDFNTSDHDNSIQTNSFDPTQGQGYCFSSNFSPNVSVVKTGPSTGTAGTNGTYTLTVTNTGPVPATNATVTDTLPTGETYVSSSDSFATGNTCTAAGQTVTCPVDSLAADSSGTISVTVAYATDASGDLTDCATVAGQATPSCVTTNIPPATQTLAGHIYLCQASGATTTEVPGGSLAATGPQDLPAVNNPLAAVSVLSGDYTMTADAPAGYEFTSACGGTATIGSPATSATEAVKVPSGGSGVGTFYVVQSKVPTQTIAGHIYLCTPGGATTTEQPGGSLSAAGPQALHSVPNPLAPVSVLSGDYTMTANAPAGYVFTSNCGGTADLGTPATTATENVNVPSDGAGVGTFYVVPSTTPTQTLTGHIYLCDGTTETSTEVPGGLLGATGPQSVPSTGNPLGPLSVSAGTYTLSATAPAGYHFTDCTPSSSGTPTNATQTVVVPPNGNGTGTFYVSPNVGGVVFTVSKTNAANGSGSYAQTETATAAGETVPFRVVVENTSTIPVDITSITDSWSGHATETGLCSGSVIGQTLNPGDSATCDFSVSGYAPAAGSSLTDTVDVTGCQSGVTGNCLTVPATSTVVTPAVVASTPPQAAPAAPASAPVAPVAAASAPVAAANPGKLAFTGVPTRLQVVLEAGFALLSAGMFLLWLTRPRKLQAS